MMRLKSCVRFWNQSDIIIMTQEKKQPGNGVDKSPTPIKKSASLRRQLQHDESKLSPTAVSSIINALLDVDISAQDYEMLSLVVDAALQGHDIAEAYPEFHRRMQLHPDLQQAYFDILATMASDQEDETLPIFPPLQLDFLRRDNFPKPVIARHSSKRWQATWHLASAHLNQQFTTALGAYRSGMSFLDEDSVFLLHSEFEVGSFTYQTTLEAILLPDDTTQITPLLLVTVTPESASLLEVTLHWGDYWETAVLNQYGCANFPPLNFNLILDEAGDIITKDILMNLQFTE
ncbi:MAG: hypothetical protein H6662_06225 [Ardenticatenaceae bacterium]|nr:hypothetical protein [Anaerolineales bacterium]MCB8921163.1 hypothetical protein [Ardenticatenaceae bacterium]